MVFLMTMIIARTSQTQVSWTMTAMGLERCDNCPEVSNPNQMTGQNNFVGVACEDTRDRDGDGVPDQRDNCPRIANPLQFNVDGDQWGDACDNCRFQQNDDQLDVDRDGRGDLCDELAPQVVVELRWGNENVDFDLHIVEPNGQFFAWRLLVFRKNHIMVQPRISKRCAERAAPRTTSEQVRIGSAVSGLFTVGVDRFPNGSVERNRSANFHLRSARVG